MDYAYEDTRRDRCLDYTILCVTVHSSIKRYERELNWVFVCCVCFGNVRRKLDLYLNGLWVAINFSFHLHYPFIVLKWMCFHACTQDHALPTCAKPLMVLNWLTSHQQYIFFLQALEIMLWSVVYKSIEQIWLGRLQMLFHSGLYSEHTLVCNGDNSLMTH